MLNSIPKDVNPMSQFQPPSPAVIYNNLYREDVAPKPTDMSLDWSANYCNMINYTHPKFVELTRLYMTIHR